MNDDMSDQLLRPLVKLFLSVAGLLLFQNILSLAPGTGRAVPDLGVQFGSILSALVGLIIVVVLLYYSQILAAGISNLSVASEEAQTAGARCLLLVAVFFSLLVIYSDMNMLLQEMYSSDHILLFYLDTGFLLASLGILLVLGYIVLSHFDPIADAIVDRLDGLTRVKKSDRNTSDTVANGGTDDGSSRTCPDCGTEYDADATFCGNCGSSLEE